MCNRRKNIVWNVRGLRITGINNPGASSEVCWFCKVMDCMRVNTQVLVRKRERSKLRGINPPANESDIVGCIFFFIGSNAGNESCCKLARHLSSATTARFPRPDPDRTSMNPWAGACLSAGPRARDRSASCSRSSIRSCP